MLSSSKHAAGAGAACAAPLVVLSAVVVLVSCVEGGL